MSGRRGNRKTIYKEQKLIALRCTNLNRRKLTQAAGMVGLVAALLGETKCRGNDIVFFTSLRLWLFVLCWDRLSPLLTRYPCLAHFLRAFSASFMPKKVFLVTLVRNYHILVRMRQNST